jgi:pyruvate kinase
VDVIKLPDHKTKIVCTIGPASRSEPVLEELMRRGTNVARLNFAHGSVEGCRGDIRCIRLAAAQLERSCLILADLPGPKIRIGKLKSDPLLLKKGDRVTLATKDVPGTAERISVNYRRLPESVSRGSVIYLNDGFMWLEVEESAAGEVVCKLLLAGRYSPIKD